MLDSDREDDEEMMEAAVEPLLLARRSDGGLVERDIDLGAGVPSSASCNGSVGTGSGFSIMGSSFIDRADDGDVVGGSAT